MAQKRRKQACLHVFCDQPDLLLRAWCDAGSIKLHDVSVAGDILQQGNLTHEACARSGVCTAQNHLHSNILQAQRRLHGC